MMEVAAIYHRSDSEYAYLYETNQFHVRLRTKKGDAKKVSLISGDPYAHGSQKWYKEDKSMKLAASTDVHDYWMIETTEKKSGSLIVFMLKERTVVKFFTEIGAFFHSQITT